MFVDKRYPVVGSMPLRVGFPQWHGGVIDVLKEYWSMGCEGQNEAEKNSLADWF